MRTLGLLVLLFALVGYALGNTGGDDHDWSCKFENDDAIIQNNIWLVNRFVNYTYGLDLPNQVIATKGAIMGPILSDKLKCRATPFPVMEPDTFTMCLLTIFANPDAANISFGRTYTSEAYIDQIIADKHKVHLQVSWLTALYGIPASYFPPYNVTYILVFEICDCQIVAIQIWSPMNGQLDYLFPPGIQVTIVQDICNEAQLSCTGEWEQYPSVNACISALSSIPLGTLTKVNANSLICRSYLSFQWQFYQPACTAASPGGGIYCIDTPYSDWYLTGQEVLSPYVPTPLSSHHHHKTKITHIHEEKITKTQVHPHNPHKPHQSK